MKKYALYLDHMAAFNHLDTIKEITAENLPAAMIAAQKMIEEENGLWAGYLYEKNGRIYDRIMGCMDGVNWFVSFCDHLEKDKHGISKHGFNHV